MPKQAPILWPPDKMNWFNRRDPDAGKYWREEEKGMTEDEMVGWHHLINRYEFKQAPGDGEGQGSLECCSLWGCKESDTLSDWTKTTIRKKMRFQKAKLLSWWLPTWWHHDLSLSQWVNSSHEVAKKESDITERLNWTELNWPKSNLTLMFLYLP